MFNRFLVAAAAALAVEGKWCYTCLDGGGSWQMSFGLAHVTVECVDECAETSDGTVVICGNTPDICDWDQDQLNVAEDYVGEGTYTMLGDMCWSLSCESCLADSNCFTVALPDVHATRCFPKAFSSFLGEAGDCAAPWCSYCAGELESHWQMALYPDRLVISCESPSDSLCDSSDAEIGVHCVTSDEDCSPYADVIIRDDTSFSPNLGAYLIPGPGVSPCFYNNCYNCSNTVDDSGEPLCETVNTQGHDVCAPKGLFSNIKVDSDCSSNVTCGSCIGKGYAWVMEAGKNQMDIRCESTCPPVNDDIHSNLTACAFGKHGCDWSMTTLGLGSDFYHYRGSYDLDKSDCWGKTCSTCDDSCALLLSNDGLSTRCVPKLVATYTTLATVAPGTCMNATCSDCISLGRMWALEIDGSQAISHCLADEVTCRNSTITKPLVCAGTDSDCLSNEDAAKAIGIDNYGGLDRYDVSDVKCLQSTCDACSSDDGCAPAHDGDATICLPELFAEKCGLVKDNDNQCHPGAYCVNCHDNFEILAYDDVIHLSCVQECAESNDTAVVYCGSGKSQCSFGQADLQTALPYTGIRSYETDQNQCWGQRCSECGVDKRCVGIVTPNGNFRCVPAFLAESSGFEMLPTYTCP